MTYKCELIEQSPQPTLFIRTTTSIKELPQELDKAYGAIEEYLANQGEHPAGAPYAAYYHFEKSNVDVEIGFPVNSQIAAQDPIQSGKLPGGKVVQCLYKGPYNKIKPAYEALTAWIEDRGYKDTGVSYEFYLNDLNEVTPEELLTRIAFPLK